MNRNVSALPAYTRASTLATLFGLAAMAPLHAQEATAAPSSTLDQVVVTGVRSTTASKTDTPITDTPQSISVITADQIAARGGIGLQEALRYTAGVRTEPNGADLRFDYVTARGGFEAAEYRDGMRVPTSYYTPRTEIYTLDRLEVLRGPSSVLYGQGAAGGIVNGLSKRPQFDTAGEVGLEIGSFERKQLQFDVTGALNDDKTVAGRLVGVVRDADNQVRFGRDDRTVLTPSLRWRPDDRTDVVLSGLYQNDRAASIASFLPIGATLYAPPGRRLADDTYLGEPSHNYYNQQQTSASLLVTHRYSDTLDYSGGLRYSHARSDNGDVEPAVWSGLANPFLDDDHRLLPRDRYDDRLRLSMVSTDHHLNWTVETGSISHQLLFGVDDLRTRLRIASAAAEADPIDVLAPVYGHVPDAEFGPDTNEVDTQLGVYVQDQIRYGDRLTLVLGARHDRASTAVDGTAAQIDNATTLRLGLIAHVTASLSPYLSYSESFQPTIGLDFDNHPFVPQRGKQVEAGAKWQPGPRTLLTLSAFDIRSTNRLATDPNNGQNQVQQAEVTSRGFEVEAAHAVGRNFSINASYSYVDARLSRSIEPLEVGAPISGVPAHQASLWGEQRVALRPDLNLRWGAGARYVGASDEAVVFDQALETVRTPSFTLVDGLLALEGKRWTLAMNATNLFDRRYYAGCSVRSACSVGYRRNLISSLTYRF